MHQGAAPHGQLQAEDFLQVLNTGGTHQVGDQAEHAVGSHRHDDLDHSLHDDVAAFHHHGHQIHSVAVLAHLGDHDAEEDSENDDLNQGAVGESGKHVIGDPLHNILDHVDLLDAFVHSLLQDQALAGAADGDGQAAQHTGDGGAEEGIQQELAADFL